MELVDVRYIGSNDQYQTYSPSDVALINTTTIVGSYGAPNDYIEYFIKDLGNNVLSANYYATQYNLDNSIVDPITGTTTQLYLDPETDARNLGYDRGIVNVKYNFFAKQLASSPDPNTNFWIKEISPSRTEIKAARQDLSNTALANTFAEFNAVLSADAYYPTVYLNFGADVQVISVNAVYVEEDGDGYVIFKLYESLPSQFDLKSTFWVVTEVAEPAEFNVTINVAPEAVIDSRQIKGPNFKVAIKDKVSQTTPYYSYESLLLTSVSSSYQQLKSMMDEKGIQINVDYSDFSNFVHFSSATERLYNFVYKMQLIESASAGLSETNTTTAKVLLQNQIDTTITNFDGYEYYLYFTSASTAWPKQNSSQPYPLYSVTSSQVVNWLGSVSTPDSRYGSASYYDDQNKDLLLYATPAYIIDDSANAPYLVFLNMIGQHFDNIWIYLKDITNHYSAENNPFVGISMDQVADALRSFGVELYTNTSITDNIYYSLLGLNQTGSALPVTSSAYATVNVASSSIYPLAGEPYLTASLSLPPFGEEKINRYVITFVTGSNPSSSFATLPASQITGETYKRLYHNLAYLLKTRGTERGIKALVTTFGIPGDILTPHEYGGYNIYQDSGIQEISNTKIITGSVLQISSSLLNPYTTLQYYQNNTDKSSNNVEVAFSPADSINASITSSGYVTSSTQPGYFNIMQLIGAPDLQYSSSYIPLVNLANTYFSAEYTSRYNVWDFIRVIKYYNNSVFKMLRDWVPARSSASTGIVIQSHMLERNKYPRHEPTFTNISGSVQIKMVSISGSDGGAVQGNTYYVEEIPIQYQSNSIYLGTNLGDVYVSSSNNIQKYTGEFSGSTIIASYNVFPQEEISSYIYPWTSSIPLNPCHYVTASMFLVYTPSPTLNNVTGAVLSQRFLDLDYNGNQIKPTNYGLVTKSLDQTVLIGNVLQSQQPYSQYAQLQDYNYNLPSTVAIRYSGSYLQGRTYNTYSVGDLSYGNDPVINYYSSKLGFFTQVATSSFLPGQVNATLGYLADVSGGLFELNQNNKSWVDVQNIFVAGTNLTIKQFDNKKYTNQVPTDGVKTIYNSGYNYTPQIYFMSGTNADPKVYFEYLGTATTDTGFSANNSGLANNFISGAASPSYPVTLTDAATRTGAIYKIFNNKISGYTGFTSGSITAYPSFTPTTLGSYVFTANVDISVGFQTTAQSASYTLNMMDGSTVLATTNGSFASSTSGGGSASGVGATGGGTSVIVSGPISGSSTITLTGPTTVSIATTVPTVTYFPAYGQYVLSYSTPGTAVPYGIAGGETVTLRIYQPTYLGNNIGGNVFAVETDTTAGNLFSAFQASNGGWFQSFTQGSTGTTTLSGNISLNVTSPTTILNTSDVVSFQLTQSYASTDNFTASINAGSLTGTLIAQGKGGYPFATASADLNPNGWFIDSIVTGSSSTSILTFTQEFSQFFEYQQVPYFLSSSGDTQVVVSSSLYNSTVGSGSYGDINVPFNPSFGDKLVISDYGGTVQVLDVFTGSFNSTTSKVSITVIPQIIGSWQANPKLIYKLLLLKRYQDEQNVILTFNKPDGPTSYGFLIPDTINPEVTANINALQAAVQSQLLSNQANTNTTL